MRFSARLLISFVFVLLISSFIATKSFAQTTSASNSALQNETNTSSSTNPNVPKNLHTYTQSVMIETMAAVICQLSGIDPINPGGQCLGIDSNTGKIGFAENGGGAIGILTNSMAMLYAPPASSIQYFQYLSNNFGVSKKANAQSPLDKCDASARGYGFCSISPLLQVWTTFRNITYLLFVIIFIVIGLAIMLRINIDARTVMTIQNQIPKIIVGLLLVTFSFAIAGFLIDIMYVSISLIGNTLQQADSRITTDLITQISTAPYPFTAANALGGASGGKGGIANIAFWSSLDVGKIVYGLFSNLIGGPLGFVLGSVLGVLGFLIILVTMLWALFRLWFALISAYVFLLLDVVMGPFWIFAGLLPGSPVNASLWLRDTISNLSAFPAAISMFMLGRLFMDLFNDPGSSGALTPPMVGGLNSNMFANLIGLGFILLTPNVVVMTKAALKAPKFDTAPIKEALGAGTGTVVGTIKTAYGSSDHEREFRPTESGQWKQIGRGRAMIGKFLK